MGELVPIEWRLPAVFEEEKKQTTVVTRPPILERSVPSHLKKARKQRTSGHSKNRKRKRNRKSQKENPNGDTKLLKYAADGNTRKVKKLLSKGVHVDEANKHGHTALFKSALNGHVDTVQLLLAAGADVFFKDSRQMTALDWTRLSHQNETESLIEKRIVTLLQAKREDEHLSRHKDRCIGVIQKNRHLRKDIKYALKQGRVDLVIEMGEQSSVNFTRNIFDEACEVLHINNEEEQFFLDIETQMGWTALTKVSAMGSLEAVQLLLKFGVAVDYETRVGHTALSWAARCGNREVAAALIMAGAKVDRRSKRESRTPLQHAAANGHPGVTSMLLDKIYEKSYTKSVEWKEELKVINEELKPRLAAMLSPEELSLKKNRWRFLKDSSWAVYVQGELDHRDKHGMQAMEEAKKGRFSNVITLLDSAYNRIQDKNSELQREANDSKPRKCVNGCGFSDRSDCITHHEQHQCPMRYVDCENNCGKQVRLNDMENHKLRDCTKRIVACLNAYSGCFWRGPLSGQKEHATLHCRKRKVKCRIGCGKSLLFDQLVYHEQERCGYRLVECRQGCGYWEQGRLLRNHMKHACPHRLVKCPIAQCDVKVKFIDLEDHVDRECSLLCKWDNCGIRVGPKARRDVHELFECPHRMIYCMHGCSTELPACEFPQHEAFCTHRMELCTTGCGAYIRAGMQFTHADPYSGDCPARLVRCPLDIANRTPIRVRRADGGWDSATVLGYRQIDDRYYLQYKPDRSISLLEDASNFAEQKEHDFAWVNLKLTQWMPIPELPETHWKCKQMTCADIPFHLSDKGLCHHAPIECDCGQIVPASCIETHQNNRCPLRWVKCRHGCGETVQALYLWDHENKDCSYRKVICKCGEFVSIEPNQHAFHMRTCKAGLFQCDLGCGSKVALRDMKNHTENKCPKRTVMCSLGCGASMWAEELKHHVDKLCMERQTFCDLCAKPVRAGSLKEHKLHSCLERLEPCQLGCGAACAISKISFHQAYDCPYTPLDCLRGCGEKVRKCDRAWHEKNVCMRRQVFCPNDCNARINADRIDEHLAVCPREIVVCLYGCGMRLRRANQSEHLAQCNLRSLPCGADQAGCQRQLRSWLHDTKTLCKLADRNVKTQQNILYEAERDNNAAILSENVVRIQETSLQLSKHIKKLEILEKKQKQIKNFPLNFSHQVLCERHNETALSYAASSGDEVLLSYLISKIPPEEIDHESLLGFTALIRACKTNTTKHLNCVRLLIENGADTNKETSTGLTPLLEACRYNNGKVITLLIEKRVDIRRRNKHGIEAVEWARRWGHVELSQKLKFNHAWMSEQKKLFHLITMNDVDSIKPIVQDGEAYKLNARRIYRDLLKVYHEELREKNAELAPKEKKYQLVSKKVEQSRKVVEDGTRLAEHLKQKSIELLDTVKRREAELLVTRGISESSFLRIVPRHIEELASVYAPPPQVYHILKCLLVLIGTPPKRIRDPKGTGKMVDDWWGAARILLKECDVPIMLRSFNLSNVSFRRMQTLRRDFIYDKDTYREWVPSMGLPKDKFEGKIRSDFLYISGEDGYPLVEALSKWFVYLDAYWIDQIEVNPIKTKAVELRQQHKKRIGELWKEREEMTRTQTKFDIIIEQYELLKARSIELGNLINLTERRLRVAEILQYQSDTGHVPLTWACACGVPKVVALLLKHGAMVDYSTDELHNESAKLIQLFYRNYHWKLTRPAWSIERAFEYRTRGIIHMFQSKLMLRRIRERRQTTRIPLAEAAWNGHLDVVETLNRRKVNTITRISCYMSAPPPFTLPEDVIVKKSTPLWLYPLERGGSDKPLGIVDLSRLAMSEMGSAEYDTVKGWVPSGHFPCYERIVKLYYNADRARKASRNDILAKKRVAKQGATRAANLKLMELAVMNSNFKEIYRLADLGTPIDHPHPETGFTGLMMAAMTETWVINSEGHHVLAVELLLDRHKRSPQIDREAANGHTPLTWAANAGKSMSVDALLRRGALVNYRTKDGRTPLIYAAMNGKPDVVFSLMDSAADVSMVDNDGKGAIAHARERNFTGVVRRLCQLRSGFSGDQVPQSGKVWEKVCSWGCGYTGTTSEINEHEKSKCVMRVVPCQFCGIRDLWYMEKENHEQSECPFRPVRCGWCKQDVRACDLKKHRDPTDGDCSDRVIECRWKCGRSFRASHQAHHERAECIHRLIRCSICNMLHEFSTKYSDCPKSVTKCGLGCGAEIRVEWLPNHEAKICPLRLVDCKWGCGKRIMFKNVRTHEVDLCKKRSVKCRYDCGNMIPLDQIKNHEENECLKRFVECRAGCGRKVRCCNMDEHVIKECRNRLVECTMEGCDELCKASELEEHIKRFCTYRMVPCGLGCGERFLIRDVEEHKKTACPKRRTKCPVCNKTLLFDELEDHRLNTCRLRMAYCTSGCGEVVVAQKMKGHLLKRCPMRLVPCRNKCGDMVRFCDREMHETSLCNRKRTNEDGTRISTQSLFSNMF